MKEIINKILCDLKELKNTIGKSITVFLEGNTMSSDMNSINFTGDVEVSSDDEGNITVDIQASEIDCESCEDTLTYITEIEGGFRYTDEEGEQTDIMFPEGLSETLTSINEIEGGFEYIDEEGLSTEILFPEFEETVTSITETETGFIFTDENGDETEIEFPSGGGGDGLRFGVSGEDDTADSERTFDLDGNYFEFANADYFSIYNDDVSFTIGTQNNEISASAFDSSNNEFYKNLEQYLNMQRLYIRGYEEEGESSIKTGEAEIALFLESNDDIGIPSLDPGINLITDKSIYFKTRDVDESALPYNKTIDDSTGHSLLMMNETTGEVVSMTVADSPFWSINGNEGTETGTNFLGTTDSVPLEFRIDNTKSGLISESVTSFGYQALLNNTNTTGISAFGVSSLENNEGSNNSAFGWLSLAQNTTGQGNSAFGPMVLYSNEDGSFNSGFGQSVLMFNEAGSNSGFGANVLRYNTSGASNSGFGFESLGANSTGSNNNAFGHSSLRSNLSGSFNNSFGNFSSYSNTTGNFNSTFGDTAFYRNVSGIANCAFGKDSLYNTLSSYNCGFGSNSLFLNTIGQYNIAIGADSLSRLISTEKNIAIGHNAGVLKSNNASVNIVDTVDWTSTGWVSGINNYTWTHTPGNTDILSHTFSPDINRSYFIQITVTGRTAGFCSLYFGNNEIPFVSTFENGGTLITSTTDNLQIEPTSDFDGTVSVVLKDTYNNSSVNSIYIGTDTQSYNHDEENEIVIGYTSIGRGSNTTTIGNSSTTSSKLFGVLNIGTTPEYADNAAALLGGLVIGDVYRTGDDLKVVH